MSEQPPRMKQRQKQLAPQPQPTSTPFTETSSNTVDTPSDSKTTVSVVPKTSTTASESQAKKPPGFESSRPTSNPPMNTDSASEWPDLLSLTLLSTAEQPQRSSAGRIQPPPVSYNPLEPSHFPPLSIPALLSVTNNNYSTAAPSVERSKASLSAAVASSIPPGFVTPQWQLIQQDSIYKSPSYSNLPAQGTTVGNVSSGTLQQGVTEGTVISMVREALDNDRERFNHFRNLSGWYRNSEITVQEYVLRCRELFGDYKWMLIGHKLAQVMPIECKRNELLQNAYAGMTQSPYEYPTQPQHFPQLLPVTRNSGITTMPAPIHMSKSEPALLPTGGSSSRAAKWGVLTNRVVPNWESKLEYPTLNPGGPSSGVRGHVQPPGLSGHGWIKARVPPV